MCCVLRVGGMRPLTWVVGALTAAGNKLDQDTIQGVLASTRRPVEITFDDDAL